MKKAGCLEVKTIWCDRQKQLFVIYAAIRWLESHVCCWCQLDKNIKVCPPPLTSTSMRFDQKWNNERNQLWLNGSTKLFSFSARGLNSLFSTKKHLLLSSCFAFIFIASSRQPLLRMTKLKQGKFYLFLSWLLSLEASDSLSSFRSTFLLSLENRSELCSW